MGMPFPRRAVVLAFAIPLMGALPSSGTIDGPDTLGWWPSHGQWRETVHLLPEESGENLPLHLRFGAQVALDGDTLVTSTQAHADKDNWFTCGYPDGCDWVYVFNRDATGAWSQTAKLVPDDARPEDAFGWAVDVDEAAGVIVVGNPGLRIRADTAYVFERLEDGSWEQTARLHKTYPGIGSNATGFGISVAVSGHRIAVTDFPGPSTYLYEKLHGEWVETHSIFGGDGALGVALAGDTLVTKPRWLEPIDCVPDGGKRQRYDVYNLIDGSWELVAPLDPQAENGNKTQTTGTRLALSSDGRTIVIGAAVDRRVFGVHTEHCLETDSLSAHTESGAAGAVGSAWIYELIDGEWKQTADIPNPMPQPGLVTGSSVFGAAVAVDGKRVVIGAYGDLYNGGEHSGAAYIYEKVGGQWVLQAKLRHQDSAEQDWFAHRVAVSGTTVVAGAHYSSSIGSVHVFEPLLDARPSLDGGTRPLGGLDDGRADLAGTTRGE